MRRPFPSLAALAAVAALVWLLLETRRLAEFAGLQEIAAREARSARDAAVAERDAATAETVRLGHELAATRAQLQAMSDLVAERTEALRTAAAHAEAENFAALRAMPEGVRRCLEALHDCLRAEGFTAQRFLSARALDEDGLHDVELLDVHGDGLGAAFVRAGRMRAALDRATGRLELRFFDGHRSAGGERAALPDDGWALVFEPIDGRSFERRLPQLVQATGAYADPARPAATTDVDGLTRRRWLERFDLLLADAGAVEQLRVTRFRGMQDGWFLDAELVGTDSRHHVVSMAVCRRLAVEVDPASGVVSLLLRDGNLRRGGIDSTISAEGYRMLLPALSVRQASDAMLGMVVTR